MVKKNEHPSININKTKKVKKTKAPTQTTPLSKREKEIHRNLKKIKSDRTLVYKSLYNHVTLVMNNHVPPNNLCNVLSDLLESLKILIYKESQLKSELKKLKSVAITTTTTRSSTSNSDNNNIIINNNQNNNNHNNQNNNNQNNNNNNNYNFTPISKPVISGVGLLPISSVESWGGGFVENFLNDKKLMDINHISPPLESNDLTPLSSHAWSSFPSSSPNKTASTSKTFDINFISPPWESNDLNPLSFHEWSSSLSLSPNKTASGSKTSTQNKCPGISKISSGATQNVTTTTTTYNISSYATENVSTTSTMTPETNFTTASTAVGPTTASIAFGSTTASIAVGPTTASTAVGPTTESTKKKRGRPSKIIPDGGCYQCKTMSTPNWRKGNVKNQLVDLCNACGLRFFKTEKKEQLSKKLNSILNVLN
ncbi:hypothetical protein ACTFIZ_008758 [Dictyostelium cf. discoideum]